MSAGLADALRREDLAAIVICPSNPFLSVDPLRLYKTAPAAYELVGSHFGAPTAEVTFLSSNRWDIAGATAFGFRCVWVNRMNLPDEYRELAPSAVVGSLDGLLALDA